MIRLFTAIDLPDDVADTLKRRQAGLPGARWRDRDHLHLTLAFYGEIDERQADDLVVGLERAATGGPFEIELEGVGAFGDAHRSSTLWAGVAAGERLGVLAGRCRSAAERAGVVMERRTYRPHVTLAYLKPQADPDRIGLYSSVVTDDGGVYTLEREYLL